MMQYQEKLPSKKEIRLIEKLATNSLSLKDIAKKIEISFQTLKKWINKYNICGGIDNIKSIRKIKINQIREKLVQDIKVLLENTSTQDISKKLGISVSLIHNITKELGLHKDIGSRNKMIENRRKEDSEKIQYLLSKQHNIEEICFMLQTHAKYVYFIMKKYGINFHIDGVQYKGDQKEKRILYEKLYYHKYGYTINTSKSPKFKKVRHLLYWAKARSKIEQVPFTLTITDLDWPDYCPVLNIKLNYTNNSGNIEFDSVTIDRLNPYLGYIKGNCKIISNKANLMKQDATSRDIGNLIKALEGSPFKSKLVFFDKKIEKARKILRSVKSKHSKKHYKEHFDLTLEDILNKMYVLCPVYGQTIDYDNHKAGYSSPSIDRIDNKKGYTKDNTWIICNKANTIKNSGNLQELKLLYKWLIDNGR